MLARGFDRTINVAMDMGKMAHRSPAFKAIDESEKARACAPEDTLLDSDPLGHRPQSVFYFRRRKGRVMPEKLW